MNVTNQNGFFESRHNAAKIYELFYSLWPNQPDDDLLHALYDYGIWNGLSFCIKNNDYLERFCFATGKDNWQIKTFYLNNLKLLKRYLIFFRENTKSLVNNFDINFLGTFTDGVDITGAGVANSYVKANLLSEKLDAPRYKIDSTVLGVHLAPREIECLYYIAHGFLLKEVAEKLGISISTVAYYLNNIKAKTKCNTRAELLNLIIANGNYGNCHP